MKQRAFIIDLWKTLPTSDDFQELKEYISESRTIIKVYDEVLTDRKTFRIRTEYEIYFIFDFKRVLMPDFVICSLHFAKAIRNVFTYSSTFSDHIAHIYYFSLLMGDFIRYQKFGRSIITGLTVMDAEIAYKALSQFYDPKIYELPKECYALLRDWRTVSFTRKFNTDDRDMAKELGQEGTIERHREFMA